MSDLEPCMEDVFTIDEVDAMFGLEKLTDASIKTRSAKEALHDFLEKATKPQTNTHLPPGKEDTTADVTPPVSDPIGVLPIANAYRIALKEHMWPDNKAIMYCKRAVKMFKLLGSIVSKRFHPTTGKCSGETIAATLICAHKDIIPDWKELAEQIYAKMDADHAIVCTKKESKHKNVQLEKYKRYTAVITHNRKIFYK